MGMGDRKEARRRLLLILVPMLGTVLVQRLYLHLIPIRHVVVAGYLVHHLYTGALILIVPIEILSQFMRLISLSVRLFANMLAGHMLILVMIGLVFIINTPPWKFFGLPGAIVFYLFEVIIVVSIQAFIFAALSAIYIGSAIEPEH